MGEMKKCEGFLYCASMVHQEESSDEGDIKTFSNFDPHLDKKVIGREYIITKDGEVYKISSEESPIGENADGTKVSFETPVSPRGRSLWAYNIVVEESN
jgi:hypothetical protein|tara:strand:+ start:132 stop:428 length:297 start_codon:yes stop_codon:yes gene_type:complete